MFRTESFECSQADGKRVRGVRYAQNVKFPDHRHPHVDSSVGSKFATDARDVVRYCR